ncbi:MAG: HmuY family protein [Leptospira sp.]|nr:HmuY family protein [Leptospira sp.]
MKFIIKKSILFILLFFFYQCEEGKQKNSDMGASALLLLQPASTQTNSTTSSTQDVETKAEGSLYSTTVNASSTSAWMYVSLKEGGKKASSDIQWDIRFKRFVIGTNSGTSGSGNGGSCDTTKSSVTDASINASTCTLVIDSVQSQTGEGGFGSASESASPSMFTWYSYDGTSHLLSSKRLVYIVRGSDGTLYRLQMLDYYSSAGTSGYMKFYWKGL